MFVAITMFNFKPGDLQAQEKQYLEVHVPLSRKLPGLRTYLTGKFRTVDGITPPYYRAAILTYDSLQAATAAIESPIGVEALKESSAYITDMRPLALEPYLIVPFDSKQVGRNYLALMGEFDIKAGSQGLEAADQEYLRVHTAIVRRLPGLRFCFTGSLTAARGLKPDRLRCAMGLVDNDAALQAARSSSVAQEIAADEGERFANKRNYQLDVTTQF
jgi:uncharacterized protein (TIGR02118 family)